MREEYEVVSEFDMNNMSITFIDGINGDMVIICVMDKFNNEIFKEKYVYGFNASYNQKFVVKDKPFIRNIIKDIILDFDVSKSNIKFYGENIFNNTVFTSKQLQDRINFIFG